MKCVILAAGYATRLYPLTENFPKPLLKVGEKSIVDWLVDDIQAGGAVDGYAVVTNHKFAPHFEAWAREKGVPVAVADDGTESNGTRLGAVKDILFAMDSLGLDDDLLVIAGDNVLDFSLNHLIRYAREKDASCVMRYWEADEKRLRKCGVAELGEDDLLLSLEEKPENPKSHWCTPPFYFYKAADARRIGEAIEDGCGTDAPGSLVAWMCAHSRVYSMEMPGKRFDIGNLESYEAAQKLYRGIEK